MVYYHRKTVARRGRRAVRRRRYRRPAMSMVSARFVRRIVDAELKFRDLGVGPVDLPTINGNITHISNVSTGDSASERTGNWIKPVTWMGTITVEADAANTNETVQYRIGCVCWKENQDANPIELVKLMQDTSAPHQYYNIQNKGQFKVLWSRTGILSTNIDNSKFQEVHKFYIKGMQKILFNNADFKNNHLFIFGYSDIPTASDPPRYSFDTRLRYTDS